MIPLAEIDGVANLYSVCRDCFLGALDGIEKHAIEFEAEEATKHRAEVRRIRSRIETGCDARSLKAASSELDVELRRYAERAREVIHERERDDREIFTILSEIAGTITDRSDRYTAQFRGLAKQLESAEELHSLSRIRSNLSCGVTRLKSSVESMQRESRASVERLQDELKVFRRRLAEAEAEAATDSLTGLANRREAEKLINLRIGSGRSLCIMLFDLDDFKRINDCYGHAVGDQVLKTFGQRLTSQFRADDVVCRWGGDEFLAVLNRTLPDPVRRASDVVSRVSRSCTVRADPGTLEIPFSVSVGAAQHKPGETSEELFTRADTLLYNARGVTLAAAPRA